MGMLDKLFFHGLEAAGNLSPLAWTIGLSSALLGFVLFKYLTRVKPGRNPFDKECIRPQGPLVTDKEKRDAVLKQGFTTRKVPDGLDVIVIGSGIGGLSCAALLAKAGKKVLVLEQHDQAGGCCHTFIEKGYEFDVGIHYVGEIYKNTLTDTLINQITDGQLSFAQVDQNIDTVLIGDPQKPVLSVPMLSGKDVWKKKLKEIFPWESAVIDEFFKQMGIARRCYPHSFILKVIPRWLAWFVIKSGLINLLSDLPRLASTPHRTFLDGLTDNQELKAVLSYSFGDYGTQPREAPMLMQLMLFAHYIYGGYYPVGGASEIAFHIIPVIEKSGGKVLVRAEVSQIIVNADGKAHGVVVRKGGEEHKIYAPLIVSAAGVINTFSRLLPSHTPKKQLLDGVLSKVRSGLGAMSVFVGLEGTNEELGLKATNMWAFSKLDLDQAVDEYLALPVGNVGNTDVPLLFISFPSTKDPTWNERYPGKSNCTIVTFANWEWFSKWEDGRVMKRGGDYEELKTRLGERVWAQTCRIYPQLKDKRRYFDVGSPVTNKYYIGSPRGEIYGLDHNLARFDLETQQNLRPDTLVPGLYLTGQDVATCGFAGALYAGLLTAGAVLHRNVLGDLMRINKEIKSQTRAAKEE